MLRHRENAERIFRANIYEVPTHSDKPATRALCERRFLTWIKRTGARRSRWRCPTGLHGKKCTWGPHCRKHELPFMDHCTCWSWGYRMRALVSQPYVDPDLGCLNDEQRAELGAACARLGLAFTEYTEASWHYPERTTLFVVYATPGPSAYEVE